MSHHREWHGRQGTQNARHRTAQLAQSRDLHRSMPAHGHGRPEEQRRPLPPAGNSQDHRVPAAAPAQHPEEPSKRETIASHESEDNRGILQYSKDDQNLSQITDHTRGLKRRPHVRKVYCEDNVFSSFGVFHALLENLFQTGHLFSLSTGSRIIFVKLFHSLNITSLS